MGSTPQLGQERDPLTERIIACAIAVHRELGPGLFEATYEAALAIEFEEQGIRFMRQVGFPVVCRGRSVGEFRIDFLVEDAVVLELKSVERFDSVFEAQVLTYLKATGKKVGLLINFNSRLLTKGVKRFVL